VGAVPVVVGDVVILAWHEPFSIPLVIESPAVDIVHPAVGIVVDLVAWNLIGVSP
jgi:hypothetical protein